MIAPYKRFTGNHFLTAHSSCCPCSPLFRVWDRPTQGVELIHLHHYLFIVHLSPSYKCFKGCTTTGGARCFAAGIDRREQATAAAAAAAAAETSPNAGGTIETTATAAAVAQLAESSLAGTAAATKAVAAGQPSPMGTLRMLVLPHTGRLVGDFNEPGVLIASYPISPPTAYAATWTNVHGL